VLVSGRTIAALTGLALLACGPATAQEKRRCAEAKAAAPIVERRQAFNAAIRDADLPAIEAVLAPDVVLVTGTDSDLFQGREAQLALWRSDFEKKAGDRMVYVRKPGCVERSDLAPIALEHGHWRGEGPAGTFAAGRYTAKWRRDGEWRIEAEVFMTTGCGGAACPE
jgi:ketosteroid isomerase-like protein